MDHDKILDFLKRKQDYVSGDQIASRLGITRQGLWKHIQELKEIGYDIIAVPHLGYKLTSIPDRLFDFEVSRDLNTKYLGKKIYYFDSVTTTMNTAVQLGLEGAPEGALVIAETQTKGRGRLGRLWFSPKYKGLYFSLILRPKVSFDRAPMLTLLTAVSICQAVKEVSGLDVNIKWPNDLMMHNKKLGGILTELNAEMDEVNFVAIGVGLNVNTERKNLLSTATSLKEQKKEPVNRLLLLQEILRKIEANYIMFQEKGAHPIIERWCEFALTLGKRVKVYCLNEHIEGEALDIDIDGGLLIRKDSGLTEKVLSGDVVHCR